MKTIDITIKETAVLSAIATSEYRDGDLADPVWSYGLEADGVSKAGMGGVFASLQSKGLVSLSGSGKEATVCLTNAGIAAHEGA